jgi:hypothetical protein
MVNQVAARLNFCEKNRTIYSKIKGKLKRYSYTVIFNHFLFPSTFHPSLRSPFPLLSFLYS